jgi:acetyltransferase-like isoleucine patch superfamily enzyme
VFKRIPYYLRRIANATRSKKISYLRDHPRFAEFEIGEYTYGVPDVSSWGEGTTLRIGKFCSISYGVQILLGGEHRTDWVTTYPFTTIYKDTGFKGHPRSKGDVQIGHDVWIASRATILSGVTIGSGAVIGTHSVVTSNVPPYGIVAGNPARLVRYRFDDEKIAALLRIEWWDWPIEKIVSAWPLLLSPRINEFITANSRESI